MLYLIKKKNKLNSMLTEGIIKIEAKSMKLGIRNKQRKS